MVVIQVAVARVSLEIVLVLDLSSNSGGQEVFVRVIMVVGRSR